MEEKTYWVYPTELRRNWGVGVGWNHRMKQQVHLALVIYRYSVKMQSVVCFCFFLKGDSGLSKINFQQLALEPSAHRIKLGKELVKGQ